MKPNGFFARSRGGVVAALLAAWISLSPLEAADFAVVSVSGSYFVNNAGPNPTLTVIRGELYTFAVTTSSTHPIRVLNTAATITNNNISSGTITWRVPTNAVNYTYECSIHHFSGTIVTIPPPAFRITDLRVGANLVVKSTGTNNWILTPQFSTNIILGNWSSLTVQSNRVVNGTNETFCGRPPGTGDNVFIRIKAQRN